MVNKTKIRNLILYFINNIPVSELGKTKLYKLIFFVDSLAYEIQGSTVTGDKYLKFPMGPVPVSVSGILHEMNENGSITIDVMLKQGYFMTSYTPNKLPDMNVFNGTELGIIGEVFTSKSKKSRSELINLSHQMSSWVMANDFEEMDLSTDYHKSLSPSPQEFVKEYKNDITILSKE